MNNLLIGAAAGSTLMFLLDPAGGRRRRALMRDQMTKATRKSRDGLDATARDMANRTSGMAAAMRRLWTSEAVDDQRLVERVRARLGRTCSHPRAIRVEAHDGHVILHGPVLSTEEQPLLWAVAEVPGVKGVGNELQAYASADGVPALQEDDHPQRQTAGVLPLRWTPTTRAMLGAGLVASGVWIARAARHGSTGTEFTQGDM